ncbi:hypothetical protein HDV04_003477 [Boothiomyces sp. JEL0838]|nr:hypothetical protein HDV04_003477 [Boothiomyces sp. JEL0838]
MSNSDSQLTSISDTIIKSIERENEHGKLAHTQSLRILYGGDYSFSGVCFHPVLSLKDNLALVHSLMTALKEAQTSPKVVRSLGWVIGNCLDKSLIMITGNSFLTNYQSDPVDYKRLNPEKSFLKSVYDRLIYCINKKQEKESLDLLTVLGDVKGSLPPVEWKIILNYINRLPQGPLKCFQFTSNQVGRNSAKSLTTKFLELFEKLSTTGHLDVVASDMGIGRLLDLAGFNNSSGLVSMNQFITIIQSVVPKLGYKSQYASAFYNIIGTKIQSYEYKASTNYEILEALLINILTEMKDIALTNSSISIIQSIVIGLGNSPPSRNKLMTLAKTAPLIGSWIVGFLMEFDLSLHSAFLDILIAVSDHGEYQTSCALSVLGSVCRLNLIPQDVQKMMIRIIDTVIILNSKNSPKQLEYYWLYVVLGFSYASNAGVGFDLYGDISWSLIASAGLLSLKSYKVSNETLENRLIALYSQLDLSKQSIVSKHIKYVIDQ